MNIRTDDLIEIIHHLAEVVTALAEHVQHDEGCDDDPCTCGLSDVLTLVRHDFSTEGPSTMVN